MLGFDTIGKSAFGTAQYLASTGLPASSAPPNSAVTGVTVTPAAATLAGGGSLQLAATVQGTNSPSQTVIWSIDAGSISQAGLVTAPGALVDEEQSITVTATSAQDGMVCGIATIVVPIKPNERDYAWLRAKVARWIRRTDLAADIPDFIMLAEKRISGDLEARLQHNVATLRTTPGVATVRLPSDFNGIRSLSIPAIGKLDYMTPEALENRVSSTGIGQPRRYTVERSLLKLDPVPDAVYRMTCFYLAEILPLANAPNGLNWLLIDHPEIYLAATLAEAFAAIRDQPSMQLWEAKYRDAVQSLNNTDWSSTGTLSVRTDTRTP